MADLSAKDSIGPMRLIHNNYRTALLNKKYYGARLETLKRKNRLLEIIIAFGTAGSGIAGFAFWKTGDGVVAWSIISGLSVVLATIKPFLDWPQEIERYGKLWGEWSSMHGALEIIEGEVKAADRLATEQIEAARKLRERTIELAKLDDTDPDPAVIKSFEVEVNRELPIDRLWMPTLDPAPTTQQKTQGAVARPATSARKPRTTAKAN